MKQIVLMMLLIGGAVLGTQAQGRWGHGHEGRGRGCERGYRVHAGGRWDDCNRSYRGAYYECRPGVRYVAPSPVIYAPAPAPVVVYAPAPPPPAPVVYVHHRPRVVINAGIVL